MMMPSRTRPGHADSKLSALAGAYPRGLPQAAMPPNEVVARRKAVNMEEDAYEVAAPSVGNRCCYCRKSRTGGGIAADTIKIGYPMPLSGPASVYGVPIVKGAEMAVQEINASGGVLGRKVELLTRDSKASADEAVRLARELIIKDNVDFLSGTLTSAEAPAVSTIAKENKIVFVAPTSKTIQLTSPANLHPYIFRLASNTDIDGRTGASIIAELEGGEAGRDHRARLCLRPRRGRRLCRLHQEGAARHRDRRPAMAEARPERLHAVHHRADGQEAGCGVLRCVRRRLRHLRQAGGPARLFQGDQQPPGRRRRGRNHGRGKGAGQRLSLRHLVRRL